MHLPLSSSTVLFAGALFGISPPRCSRGGRRQARREHGRAESPLSGPKHGANAHHAGRQQQKPWVVGLARICCGVDVTSLSPAETTDFSLSRGAQCLGCPQELLLQPGAWSCSTMQNDHGQAPLYRIQTPAQNIYLSHTRRQKNQAFCHFVIPIVQPTVCVFLS